MEDLLAFGRQNPADRSEPFNMAYLAVRGSGQVNGVSKLHGEVSRHIFQPLFPRWPQQEVPIGSVTNGIHVPTWDSAEADALWTEGLRSKRWRGDSPVGGGHSATERRAFVADADRSAKDDDRSRAQAVCPPAAAEGGTRRMPAAVFDEDALTLGFARRFATYKRPNLLLHDPERLVRLLTDPQRPVQLVLAGKAHPQDMPGQALIKQWNDFISVPKSAAGWSSSATTTC